MPDSAATDPLPGEERPIPYAPGRAITEAEALGVARRLARRLQARGKRPSSMAAEAWPADDDLSMAAWRVPTGALYMARARAEAEGTGTISDIVRALINGYGRAPMGSVAAWVTPDEAERLGGE
jgi:hypothetical protein